MIFDVFRFLDFDNVFENFKFFWVCVKVIEIKKDYIVNMLIDGF